MSGPLPRVATRFLVSGRVQGVYFRAFTRERARELGIDGWVRNLPDGRVECVAAGTPEDLACLRAVLELGPPAASVMAVEEGPWEGVVAKGFETRR
ncbi:MAG TPA: acylphosphatase [Thermoanaerobaculia bacterium]|nr:acylphosphatase [Thermoanaerobaculia bacterium]